jgi:hypothetical protein
MRSTHEWTKKEISYLCKKYAYYTNQELADRLGVTIGHVSSKATKLGLRGKLHGRSGRFEKGIAVWNKGLKGLACSPATQFKKGHTPATAKHDGAISVIHSKNDKNAYKYIRKAKSNWALLHRDIWERHNGEIPKSHVITFIDGDSMNCNIENLECIPRSELAHRNRCDAKRVAIVKSGVKEARMIDNDNYVAGRMTKDKVLKKEIKKNKDLIELKRNLLILRRETLNAKRRISAEKA